MSRGGALLLGVCEGMPESLAGSVVWKQRSRPGGEKSVN